MNIISKSYTPGPLVDVTVTLTVQELAALQQALASLPTGHIAIPVIQSLASIVTQWKGTSP